MYGSFKDFAQPSKGTPIPQQMIDYFNSTVPNTFEYRKSRPDDQICVLVPKDGSALQMEKLRPMLTEKQERMVNGQITFETVKKMMDNTLEEVEFDGSGANLNLDDEQISFGYLIRTVEDNQAANAARLFARKEPLRIEMPLKCDGEHLAVPLIQQPSDSIDILNFRSDTGALAVSMSINTADHTIDYKCDFKNSNEPNARRCLTAAVIADGLRTGKTVIDGFGEINQTPDKDDGRRIGPFWKKVVDVEDALGVTFRASEPLDKATFAHVERLHRCICEGKAVGLGFKPDSISIKIEGDAPDCEGTTCRLLFPRKENLTIFGEQFTVYSNVGLHGITLGQPELVGDGEYKVPITYIADYQCSILYLAANPEGNNGNAERVSEILFEALPEGRRY